MTLAAALAGAVMISFSAIFFALSGVDPVTGAFFRWVYALPLLLLLWLARRHLDHRPTRKRLIAFGAGLMLGLDVILWHTAIEHIGTGLATLIANSQVVFVAIAAWAIFGEVPSRRVMVAIPVVLIGVGLVSGVGQAGAFGSNPVLGTGLALLAALLYSGFLLGFRASNEMKAPPAGPLLEATIGALVSTSLVGLLWTGIDLTPTWPAHGWLLALALGPQALAWLMIGYALPRLPAVETSTIILLQPALTLVWGALIFTERPSTLQMFGAFLILVGVGTVALSTTRPPPEPVPAA